MRGSLHARVLGLGLTASLLVGPVLAVFDARIPDRLPPSWSWAGRWTPALGVTKCPRAVPPRSR